MARCSTWRQSSSKARSADARTDIFAFGTLLFEMATGKRAFEGESRASLIASILTAQPPPVSSARGGAERPPALDHVVGGPRKEASTIGGKLHATWPPRSAWVVEGGFRAAAPGPLHPRGGGGAAKRSRGLSHWQQ